MKAESTGSNPGGDTTKANAVSDALHKLMTDVGSATFHLNSIVVGLDAVEKGHPKPDGLVISWEPKDRTSASRAARKFAVECTTVRVAEALQNYIGDISALPRFKAISDKWRNQKVGRAQRLDDISSNVICKNDYLISGGMLLIGWRNQIVHGDKFTMSQHRKAIIIKNRNTIYDKYSHFDVDELFEHIQRNRPTLKDVSSLTSMAINLARKVDAKIYANFTKEDVVAWLEFYDLLKVIYRVRAETAPDKIPDSLKRIFLTHAPNLYPEYLRFFASDGSDL